ncbi:efflux RND transporter periplasmic adaptor subunit [Pigmentiphaga sp.]|uniref:efflux RND transporter periplasmic adaptor subunit n=1 Tax=Pigmentiphaga sp. TaxID=1977564 RepID=UPI0025E4C4CC|nr:efflux RND transporter periplasmic adaptor subunit [Pigmentiphaga sp.]
MMDRKDNSKAAAPVFTRTRTVLAAVIAVAAVAGVWSMRHGGSKAVAAPQPETSDKLFRPTERQWKALAVQPVQMKVFDTQVTTEGKIAIDENRATRIFAPFSGRVTKLLAGSGDRVTRGQQLFVVEAADSIDAQKDFVSVLGDINKAKTQVELTSVVEQRLASLYQDEAVPKKDWDEARAALTAAQTDLHSSEIALQAVRNRLLLLGKTDAEIARFRETGKISPDAPVYSPIAGIVLQRNVGPGQYLDAGAADGTPALLVGDVSRVWLAGYVREAEAALVKVGQNVDFSILTLPGQRFQAKVDYVGSSLDPESRRLLVRASVDNATGVLKPEMFANVRIVIDRTAPSPAIPKQAVIHEGSMERVWIAHDDGAVELRPVRTGVVNGDLVQIVDGLAEGDKVVSGGSLFIDRAATLRTASK